MAGGDRAHDFSHHFEWHQHLKDDMHQGDRIRLIGCYSHP